MLSCTFFLNGNGANHRSTGSSLSSCHFLFQTSVRDAPSNQNLHADNDTSSSTSIGAGTVICYQTALFLQTVELCIHRRYYRRTDFPGAILGQHVPPQPSTPAKSAKRPLRSDVDARSVTSIS